jgi:hypothetical protein
MGVSFIIYYFAAIIVLNTIIWLAAVTPRMMGSSCCQQDFADQQLFACHAATSPFSLFFVNSRWMDDDVLPFSFLLSSSPARSNLPHFREAISRVKEAHPQGKKGSGQPRHSSFLFWHLTSNSFEKGAHQNMYTQHIKRQIAAVGPLQKEKAQGTDIT